MDTSIIPVRVLTLGSMDQSCGKVQRGTRPASSRCGEQLPVTNGIISNLEQLKARPWAKSELASGELRKIYHFRLVPDLDSLRPHLERANYLAYVQQHYQLRSHPSPVGHEWHLENDLCLTIRYTKPPHSQIHISTNKPADRWQQW